MKARLYTSKLNPHGQGSMVANYPDGFVCEHDILEYKIPPAAVYWGQRFFVYVGKTEDHYVYREDFMLVLHG